MRYLFILFLLLSACSTPPETFTPVRATSQVASFDGNEQNSGIVGYTEGQGFELTESAVSRYNKLAVKFQEEPVSISIKDNKFFLTKEGMVHFLELSDKDRNK